MPGFNDFEEVPVISAAKRCGVQWAPWMGDWFTSWSPRNDNSNAEGSWEHWTELAIRILQHEATAIVRPDAHAAVADLMLLDPYSETKRKLTEDEIKTLFARGGDRG